MRITFVHKPPTGGWFGSPLRHLHTGTAYIEFSAEELRLIDERGLWKSVAYQIDPKKVTTFYKVREDMPRVVRDVSSVTIQRVHKDGYINEHFHTAIEAQEWEQKMRNDILPTLKHLIIGPATVEKSETYEL